MAFPALSLARRAVAGLRLTNSMPRIPLRAVSHLGLLATIGLSHALAAPDRTGIVPAVAGACARETPASAPPSGFPGETETPAEFARAGACARCHVFSVLEWGLSGHLDTDTDCQACHGPSRGHVLDERNEVKPDCALDNETKVTGLCRSCHEEGCPRSNELESCQSCHHVHALLHPAAKPAEDHQLVAGRERWAQFQKEMAVGDRHLQNAEWQAARTAFQAAARLFPDDDGVGARLAMCARRLRPDLPGFDVTGKPLDTDTGLPREVTVVGLEMAMRLVPPGEFDLGSDDLAESRPVHTVRVSPFYLARHEITQADWESVMGVNPSAHQGPGYPDARRLPVECVSWDDCLAFVGRLNARVPGAGFRLPTEAEWEYACRAGSATPLSREPLPERAWFRANSLRQPAPDPLFLSVDAYAPRPVGTRRPNAWGFHDMQGNVWEWCSSSWRPYPLPSAAGQPLQPGTGLRLLRGGGFADDTALLDPSLRHGERPHRRLRWNGLRLARDVPPGSG